MRSSCCCYAIWIETRGLFSKYELKLGKYDKFEGKDFNFNVVKYYSLKMALEAKFLSNFELEHMLKIELIKKI